MVSELNVKALNDLVTDVIAEVRAEYDGSNNDLHGFRDLRVWQVGMDLVAKCYEVSSAFPVHEQYGLTSQIRRASVSIVLNIAEGWGRNGKAEFARFADMAFGSLTETDACFDVAVRPGYLPESNLTDARELASRLSRMLHKFRTALRS